ncbi:MAG: glycosyl hydrolase family 28-related protein [Bacteroidota bacterium]|nr:glycosyl hydrolase family 28-related protein [Bacteroidota bacterium]
MRKILILTLFIYSVYSCFAQITATQMGMLDFKVDQNLSAADMNGTNDVTTKLQAAVNNARNDYKTLFIPSGTYKISAPIDCVLDESASPQKATNIVGSSIQHPVIKIADNTTSYFNNSSLPTAAIRYHTNNTAHGTDWVMEGGIRSVDFDLGANNPGAVAIYWGCAQYCYVEDININAQNGFAGLTNIGGANCSFTNITVTGGQYGVYLPSSNYGTAWNMAGSPQNTLVGCSFINQTNTSLSLIGWGGITLVGVNIVKPSGTAIKMNCGTYASVNEFTLSIIDSKIELTSPQTTNCAISNTLHGSISLRGFYTKGARFVSNNNGDENLIPTGQLSDWTQVNRYDYIDKQPRFDQSKVNYAGIHFDAVTGTQYNNAVAEISVSTPPNDLISKHIWANTPSFEDADAYLVPAGSTATTIQNAINANAKVCLPKGIFILSTPLTLKSNTILVGCPGRGSCGSILKYGWTPTTQTWLINTEDNADATTYLMDVTTDPGNADYLGSLHWMAGRNSIIRDVRFDLSWDNNEKNMIRMYFSGNGGGRVFNYQDEKSFSGSVSQNSIYHRKVKVLGTSQKLEFYGLNLERGGSFPGESSFPLIEITNSSNVLIYGAKTETYQPYSIITNSSNIFMTNIIDLANINKGLTKQNYIEIVGAASDKIEISNAMFLSPPSSLYFIVKDPWNTNSPNRTMFLGLYHRNLTTFFNGNTTAISNPFVESNWKICPNPTNSTFCIKSNSGLDSYSKADLYSVLGEKLKEIKLDSNSTKVDMSFQQNGIYMVVIQNDKGNGETIKLVKN